jgi:hypothetical protein
MNDYISGEKFINITDFKYFPNNINDNDFNIFENTFTVENIDKFECEIISVYTHIHFIPQFYTYIRKYNIIKKIVLVTHNSDDEINNEIWYQKPENIVYHFSQNINYNDSKLISLPIGLENLRWHPYKIPLMINKLNEVKKMRNLLFICHNINTFRAEREKPYEIFKDKPWCTLVEGRNGQNFDNYIDNIYNHKFILAARGHGIDSHRIFEGLYMKNYIILIRNVNNSQYSDLPIVYVDDWEEITEDFLNKKYIEINENIQNNIYNFEKLKFSYWKDLIFKAANRI